MTDPERVIAAMAREITEADADSRAPDSWTEAVELGMDEHYRADARRVLRAGLEAAVGGQAANMDLALEKDQTEACRRMGCLLTTTGAHQ